MMMNDDELMMTIILSFAGAASAWIRRKVYADRGEPSHWSHRAVFSRETANQEDALWIRRHRFHGIYYFSTL